MRPLISPGRIAKGRLSTATSPPNRFVKPRVSSNHPFSDTLPPASTLLWLGGGIPGQPPPRCARKAYLVSFTVIPDTARRKSTPCPTPDRLMTTPLSFRIDEAPIPPPTVPAAVAATYVPSKSLTFFKL